MSFKLWYINYFLHLSQAFMRSKCQIRACPSLIITLKKERTEWCSEALDKGVIRWRRILEKLILAALSLVFSSLKFINIRHFKVQLIQPMLATISFVEHIYRSTIRKNIFMFLLINAHVYSTKFIYRMFTRIRIFVHFCWHQLTKTCVGYMISRTPI